MLTRGCSFLFEDEWRVGTGPSAATCTCTTWYVQMYAYMLAVRRYITEAADIEKCQAKPRFFHSKICSPGPVMKYITLFPPREATADVLCRQDQQNMRSMIDVHRAKALQGAASLCRLVQAGASCRTYSVLPDRSTTESSGEDR